ncbi:MAG: hypothetical protein RLZ10_1391 [Bacteroidota bacterium]|jgi:hypothetical protein
MEQVRYAVISDSDTEMMVIVQDGGIATCHHNGNHIITEYYQDRIDRENVGKEEFWDILAEGKMYVNDWEDKQTWDDEVVQDILGWLYCSTEEVEFVKCDLDFENNDAVKKFITE